MADDIVEEGGSEGGSFDMESAVESMSADLFGEKVGSDPNKEVGTDQDEPLEAAEGVKTPVDKVADAVAPITRSAPKSWKAEMHEHFAKLDPSVQEYVETRENQMAEGVKAVAEDARFGKTLKEVIAPYKGLIQAQGLTEDKAIGTLLNAHHILTNAPPQQKAQYLSQLARSYGIDLGQTPQTQTQVDPMVRQLQQQVSQITNQLTQTQTRELEAKRLEVSTQVEKFASADHPYFDEVADDIVAYINAGHSLEDAYQKAVWANPLSRQKEIDRISKEEQAKFKENARLEGLSARKASATNLNGRDTRRTPTEKLGSMEDTMRETLKSIKSQTH